MADPGALQAATISIGQTVIAYQFFLPNLREVRRAEVSDTKMRGDVRLGQFAAGAVSASVGAMLSWMTGSSLPLIVTVFIAVIIAAVYQYALNGNEVMES